MIGSEVWKAWYKATFLFPLSLIYVCRFVLPVIENSSSKSSAKVLTNYEKKKDSAGNMSMADENSIVVVWLVQTFQSVVLTNKSYWLSYKKLSENIVYVSGTVSIVPRTTAVVRSHNSWYAHVQQLMCMRSTAAVHPLDISKREYRILSLKAVMLVV